MVLYVQEVLSYIGQFFLGIQYLNLVFRRLMQRNIFFPNKSFILNPLSKKNPFFIFFPQHLHILTKYERKFGILENQGKYKKIEQGNKLFFLGNYLPLYLRANHVLY